jgi:hypothetical protein
MAQPRPATPLLLIVAAFSRHADALDWARARLEALCGPVGLTSPAFAFDQTTYYEATMGPHLRKQFFAFRDLVDPACLADLKLRTNDLERALAESGTHPEPRPLNLDPGLLALGKFVLATTKDQAHRVYLHSGVFAEVTLHFRAGAFEPWPWTYADYRTPELRAFLAEARQYYSRRLRERAAEGAGSA